MVNWVIANDMTMKEWDKKLVHFSDYDFYQSYNWGEYKKDFGWIPYRSIAIDSNNKIIAMAQCLLRSLPCSVGISWCPGGPIGDYRAINTNFIELYCKEVEKRILYFRIGPKNILCDDSSNFLVKTGWKTPKYKITSGLSMYLDLTVDEENLKAKFSKNWRRNFNRFKKEDLFIRKWENINIEEMIDLYRDVERFKKIGVQYTDIELRKIFYFFKDKITIYRCDNSKGALVAFRGAIILGSNAYDFFAATHESARKLYPSNRLLWIMILHCKRIGISYYDLGGIDPINNPGVYNFKKGTGAKHFESLGEWEWSNLGLLRIALNSVIRKRMS